MDFHGTFANVRLPFVFAFTLDFQFLSGTPSPVLSVFAAAGTWNHMLLQWQGAKVVLSTIPASGVQNHFLWEVAEETCRRWKMVNEVILAKLQGFLLGMLIVVFNNTLTTIPPKACGRILISFKRSQVKHVKLHVWVKHKHPSQGFGVLCVCMKTM